MQEFWYKNNTDNTVFVDLKPEATEKIKALEANQYKIKFEKNETKQITSNANKRLAENENKKRYIQSGILSKTKKPTEYNVDNFLSYTKKVIIDRDNLLAKIILSEDLIGETVTLVKHDYNSDFTFTTVTVDDTCTIEIDIPEYSNVEIRWVEFELYNNYVGLDFPIPYSKRIKVYA